MHHEAEKRPARINRLKSRQRLSEISHHFLSDSESREPVWRNTQLVPILIGSKNHDYLVYQLERAFNHQHRTSMVLNIEGRMDPMRPFCQDISQYFSAHALQADESGRLLPDFCLVPVTSPATTLALRCEHLVLAMHASLPGLRIAYNQLSFLASLKTDFRVGIVVHGARTSAEGQRFYSFLRRNAKSLLATEIQVQSVGTILNTDETKGGISHNIEKAANQIANAYIKPGQRHWQSRTDVNKQPPALLS